MQIQVAQGLTLQQVTTTGDWHAEQASKAWTRMEYEKNNSRIEFHMNGYIRHIRIADAFRRRAWIMERTRIATVH